MKMMMLMFEEVSSDSLGCLKKIFDLLFGLSHNTHERQTCGCLSCGEHEVSSQWHCRYVC